jgi:hypothetical protein
MLRDCQTVEMNIVVGAVFDGNALAFLDTDRGVQVGKRLPKAGYSAGRCQPFGNARIIVDQPVQRHLDLDKGSGRLRQGAQGDFAAEVIRRCQ